MPYIRKGGCKAKISIFPKSAHKKNPVLANQTVYVLLCTADATIERRLSELVDDQNLSVI